MAGFSSIGVEQALRDLQEDYNQLINEGVVNYQESAIKRICDNWQSDKAVEQVNKIVAALNVALDEITKNLKEFFPAVEEVAKQIAIEEHGNYNIVGFAPIETRFESTVKATNDEGNIDCKREQVSSGFENLDKFLDNRLKKNMDDFEIRAQALAKAFDYDDHGDRFRDQLKLLSNRVGSFAVEIQKRAKAFHSDFEGWAEQHNFKIAEDVENLTNYTVDSSGLSNFEW